MAVRERIFYLEARLFPRFNPNFSVLLVVAILPFLVYVCSARGILFSMKPVGFHFIFLSSLPLFLIQRAGESLKLKLGIPYCSCAVFLFPFVSVFDSRAFFSSYGVRSVISGPCFCLFHLFFPATVWLFFFPLCFIPFHLFSPFRFPGS